MIRRLSAYFLLSFPLALVGMYVSCDTQEDSRPAADALPDDDLFTVGQAWPHRPSEERIRLSGDHKRLRVTIPFKRDGGGIILRFHIGADSMWVDRIDTLKEIPF